MRIIMSKRERERQREGERNDSVNSVTSQTHTWTLHTSPHPCQWNFSMTAWTDIEHTLISKKRKIPQRQNEINTPTPTHTTLIPKSGEVTSRVVETQSSQSTSSSTSVKSKEASTMGRHAGTKLKAGSSMTNTRPSSGLTSADSVTSSLALVGSSSLSSSSPSSSSSSPDSSPYGLPRSSQLGGKRDSGLRAAEGDRGSIGGDGDRESRRRSIRSTGGSGLVTSSPSLVSKTDSLDDPRMVCVTKRRREKKRERDESCVCGCGCVYFILSLRDFSFLRY